MKLICYLVALFDLCAAIINAVDGRLYWAASLLCLAIATHCVSYLVKE